MADYSLHAANVCIDELCEFSVVLLPQRREPIHHRRIIDQQVWRAVILEDLAEELPPGMAAVPLNPGVIDTAMLRACWADGAASCPKAEQWVKQAAPFILQLGAKDNGKSVSVGDAGD